MICFSDFDRQGEEIRKLRNQIEEHRLVHAVLITGDPGTGKRTLANLIASALMCKSGSGIPCGQCSGCKLSFSGEHPDITVIEKGIPISSETSKGRSTIPVDDIREMIRICSQYAYEGGNRVVVISDAENMTVQAQNCLLKILEEPPENTYFVLTSSHPEQMLTTVRSRCMPLKLVPWDKEYIKTLLTEKGIGSDKAERAASASSGSIETAFRLASDDQYWQTCEDVMNAFFRSRKRSDILTLSSGWKDRKSEAEILFNILEDYVRQFLLFRLESDRKQNISMFPEEWQKFASAAPLERICGLNDKISEARKQNYSNVNFQAIIEQLLFAFIGESDQWVH